MKPTSTVLLEKIRQQFDFGPYPRVPLECYPGYDYNQLFIHSAVTPYYLKYQRVLDPTQLTILDAGCGTGFTTLTLALANPGAQIVGIDLSPESVKLAQQRLSYHGLNHLEFRVMSILDLPQLGLQFDYINCDEVLYLMDPVQGLAAMTSVLTPRGLIRANLHSALQRAPMFRAQELFQLLGLMEQNPKDLEMELVRQLYESLMPNADLHQTWKPEKGSNPEYILMNFLFQGDRGYRMTDLFRALEQTDLEFISMTNWREWDVLDLFQDLENLPLPLAFGLSEATISEKLHLYELLHPVHRLLDFWCGQPQSVTVEPVSQWSDAAWQQARVHWHPVLNSEALRQAMIEAVLKPSPLNLTQFLSLPADREQILLDSTIASVLLALWEGSQSFMELVQRYCQIRPLNPVTLAPIDPERAFQLLRQLLTELEGCSYVLLERG
jgi:2-polyprenyl-3-methyl-5-hydroxy-6-metoxy-1,4-benzoquinol methylase